MEPNTGIQKQASTDVKKLAKCEICEGRGTLVRRIKPEPDCRACKGTGYGGKWGYQNQNRENTHRE